jgi:hypothetical protein
MNNDTTLVHVTHEAVDKIGGIGAVLQGFFTSRAYCNAVGRSILVGPLFSVEGPVTERLGHEGEVLYSSIDGFVNSGYASTFRNIEHYYNAGIVYGRKNFVDDKTEIKSSVEVLLIDVRQIEKGIINEFKKNLYEEFAIESHLHEQLWDYEQYVRLAPPAIAALKAIGAGHESTTIISHEFMGMPTALAAILDPCDFKTVFYAHEVATMRRLVENYPGHDTMFYNAMEQAHENNLYVNDVFGDQNDFFKHPLVEASKYCNTICAVGDYTAKELLFLAPQFENANINIVYNGIPAYKINLAEKLESKEKLRQYSYNLLGYKPDFIFTHVTRLVRSKGLWRDLRVLEHMDEEFRTQNKTGIMFLLSTEVHQRRSSDIFNMESSYNWPVAHREGMPDLSGGEAGFYTAIQQFNAKSRNIKVVFINQFGFEQRLCGSRMPEDMEFMDIRKGSDVEFGLSIYEPFGIAQLECLTFGGICAITNVCGCAGFVRNVTKSVDVKNVLVVDYTNLDHSGFANIDDPLQIDRDIRDQIEDNISDKVAMQICSRLKRNESEMEEMIDIGYNLAAHMSWDVVLEDYLLPSLQKAAKHKIFEDAQDAPSLS